MISRPALHNKILILKASHQRFGIWLLPENAKVVARPAARNALAGKKMVIKFLAFSNRGRCKGENKIKTNPANWNATKIKNPLNGKW